MSATEAAGRATAQGAANRQSAPRAGPRMECRICWHVYDPALGDELGQIAPGAPFEALPPHWRCPRCDAPKESFLECA